MARAFICDAEVRARPAPLDAVRLNATAASSRIGDEVRQLVLERALNLPVELCQTRIQFHHPLRPFGVTGSAAELRVPNHPQTPNTFVQSQFFKPLTPLSLQRRITASLATNGNADTVLPWL